MGGPVFWGHFWWQLLYQSEPQQETDGMLRKIIGGIFRCDHLQRKVRVRAQARHSEAERNFSSGKLLPPLERTKNSNKGPCQAQACAEGSSPDLHHVSLNPARWHSLDLQLPRARGRWRVEQGGQKETVLPAHLSISNNERTQFCKIPLKIATKG